METYECNSGIMFRNEFGDWECRGSIIWGVITAEQAVELFNAFETK